MREVKGNNNSFSELAYGVRVNLNLSYYLAIYVHSRYLCLLQKFVTKTSFEKNGKYHQSKIQRRW